MSFDHERLDRAMKEAREKAKRELDYDDDGDVDGDDFKTKKGRRALVIAAVVVLIILAIVFGSPAQAEEEEGMRLPMDCGRQVCVLPRDVLLGLVKSYNDQVDELRRLKDAKPAVDCKTMKST